MSLMSERTSAGRSGQTDGEVTVVECLLRLEFELPAEAKEETEAHFRVCRHGDLQKPRAFQFIPS